MTDHPRTRPGHHLHAVDTNDDNNPTPPPNDQDAEKAVLGACLLSRDAINTSSEIITPTDFYQPRHELIYDAILHLHSRGLPADQITVADHLEQAKNLTRAGGQVYLFELPMAPGAMAHNAGHYATIVARHAGSRRLVETGQRLVQLGYMRPDGDLPDILQAAHTELDAIRTAVPGVDTEVPGLDIDDFLAGEDDPYDWLIPGVLERQDRLILTAGEGMGKSTLCRQLGIQAAAGIHPFTGENVRPIKVLILDLENTKRQSRRKLRPMRIAAGKRLDRSQLIIECRTGGIDLNQTAEDRAWLNNLVAHHQPDLLITGPIYKMASGDTDKEKDSKPVAMALDRLRDTHDIAIILEAHSRKAEDHQGKKRAKEPVGWSGWMRWPEFGLHLSDDGEITHWRGPRDEREFPHQLNRGGTWPWTASMTINNQNWVKIRQAIRDAGGKLSIRELEDATGLSRSTVQRTQHEHGVDLANLYYELGMEQS